MQADTVLKKELGVLHLDLYTAGRTGLALGLAWAFETSNPTPSDTLLPTKPQLLQNSHTSNPSQVVLLSDDLAFNYVSLWG